MGLPFTKLQSRHQRKNSWKEIRILMAGLDGAGKTTILYRLKVGEMIVTTPTDGFNSETIRYRNNISFTVWDVGGQKKLRSLWKHYYQNTLGVIFVVDSNDRDRIAEARDELHLMLTDIETERMGGDVVLVVFAHKQDLPNAMSLDEISHKLALHSLRLSNYCKSHILATSAVDSTGLYEGLDWLSNANLWTYPKRPGCLWRLKTMRSGAD